MSFLSYSEYFNILNKECLKYYKNLLDSSNLSKDIVDQIKDLLTKNVEFSLKNGFTGSGYNIMYTSNDTVLKYMFVTAATKINLFDQFFMAENLLKVRPDNIYNTILYYVQTNQSNYSDSRDGKFSIDFRSSTKRLGENIYKTVLNDAENLAKELYIITYKKYKEAENITIGNKDLYALFDEYFNSDYYKKMNNYKYYSSVPFESFEHTYLRKLYMFVELTNNNYFDEKYKMPYDVMGDKSYTGIIFKIFDKETYEKAESLYILKDKNNSTFIKEYINYGVFKKDDVANQISNLSKNLALSKLTFEACSKNPLFVSLKAEESLQRLIDFLNINVDYDSLLKLLTICSVNHQHLESFNLDTIRKMKSIEAELEEENFADLSSIKSLFSIYAKNMQNISASQVQGNDTAANLNAEINIYQKFNKDLQAIIISKYSSDAEKVYDFFRGYAKEYFYKHCDKNVVDHYFDKEFWKRPGLNKINDLFKISNSKKVKGDSNMSIFWDVLFLGYPLQSVKFGTLLFSEEFIIEFCTDIIKNKNENILNLFRSLSSNNGDIEIAKQICNYIKSWVIQTFSAEKYFYYLDRKYPFDKMFENTKESIELFFSTNKSFLFVEMEIINDLIDSLNVFENISVESSTLNIDVYNDGNIKGDSKALDLLYNNFENYLKKILQNIINKSNEKDLESLFKIKRTKKEVLKDLISNIELKYADQYPLFIKSLKGLTFNLLKQETDFFENLNLDYLFGNFIKLNSKALLRSMMDNVYFPHQYRENLEYFGAEKVSLTIDDFLLFLFKEISNYNEKSSKTINLIMNGIDGQQQYVNDLGSLSSHIEALVVKLIKILNFINSNNSIFFEQFIHDNREEILFNFMISTSNDKIVKIFSSRSAQELESAVKAFDEEFFNFMIIDNGLSIAHKELENFTLPTFETHSINVSEDNYDENGDYIGPEPTDENALYTLGIDINKLSVIIENDKENNDNNIIFLNNLFKGFSSVKLPKKELLLFVNKFIQVLHNQFLEIETNITSSVLDREEDEDTIDAIGILNFLLSNIKKIRVKNFKNEKTYLEYIVDQYPILFNIEKQPLKGKKFQKLVNSLSEYEQNIIQKTLNLINGYFTIDELGSFIYSEIKTDEQGAFERFRKIKASIAYIASYAQISQFLERAIANKKDESLFNANLESDKFRFRVLKDLDPYHFQVGLDTNCCQAIGNHGEAAAIDSFINPTAGVLLLEFFIKGSWELMCQSYFHGVVENGKKKYFILDNIEKTSLNIDSNTIDNAYAVFAKKLETIGWESVLCGKQYTVGLNMDNFDSKSIDSDPRHFEYEETYTDFDNHNAVDLLSPKFNLSNVNLQSYDIQKLANILVYFIENNTLMKYASLISKYNIPVSNIDLLSLA